MRYTLPELRVDLTTTRRRIILYLHGEPVAILPALTDAEADQIRWATSGGIPQLRSTIDATIVEPEKEIQS